MPRRPSKHIAEPAAESVPVFLVSFEHAQHSFKCVRIDWERPDGHSGEQWVVTVAGRPVWSFESTASDTRDSVQRQVRHWWDETH